MNYGGGSIHNVPNIPPGQVAPPFPANAAFNGCSVDPATGQIVLGDDGGGVGLADLISNRFIESAGFNIRIQNAGVQLLETIAPTNEVAASIPNTVSGIPLVGINPADNILKQTGQSFVWITADVGTVDATPTTIFQNAIGALVLENHNFHLMIQCIVDGTATSKSFIVQCSNNGSGATGTGITIIAAIGAAGLAAATIAVSIAGDVMDIQVVGIAGTSILWNLAGFRAIVATVAP